MHSTSPNQVSVSDVTAVRIAEGWLYLASLLDLFSRHVVGWAMSETNDVGAALRAVLRSRCLPSDPLHRSDRRSPDASLQYRTELPSHGLRRSMGRRGKSWKNVMAKSFFSSLKTEHIPAQAPPGAAAQAAINESIDGYYNLSTRHSQNGHLSPSSSSRRDRPRDTRQNT